MLEACIKEYRKLYLEHENLEKKKRKTKSSKRNCWNIETIAGVVEQQTRLLRIERLNLVVLILMKKHWEIYCLVPKIENYKRHYYDDIYSDDGVESDNEFSENDDKEIGQKKKKSQGREL